MEVETPCQDEVSDEIFYGDIRISNGLVQRGKNGFEEHEQGYGCSAIFMAFIDFSAWPTDHNEPTSALLFFCLFDDPGLLLLFPISFQGHGKHKKNVKMVNYI